MENSYGPKSKTADWREKTEQYEQSNKEVQSDGAATAETKGSLSRFAREKKFHALHVTAREQSQAGCVEAAAQILGNQAIGKVEQAGKWSLKQLATSGNREVKGKQQGQNN